MIIIRVLYWENHKEKEKGKTVTWKNLTIADKQPLNFV